MILLDAGAAISVSGQSVFLVEVRKACRLPFLIKDFIIDPWRVLKPAPSAPEERQKQVFRVDVENSPNCGGAAETIASITQAIRGSIGDYWVESDGIRALVGGKRGLNAALARLWILLESGE